MEAGTPGFIPFTKGRRSNRRYTNTTIWVDKISKYIHHDHQETTNAKETLISKTNLENFANLYNRKINHIHSDNGIYASKAFTQSIESSHQTHSICGVGAHWQNGSVESYIGTLTAKARTMLLHAMEQWGTIITTEFWPYAISHAIRIHNSALCHKQTKCPYMLFIDEDTPHKTTDYRTLFCPVLVLEHELQDGNTIPKFSRKRSHIGVYVGHSPNHASNVILVYNPLTGLVSPQYHCVFDEAFATVQNND